MQNIFAACLAPATLVLSAAPCGAATEAPSHRPGSTEAVFDQHSRYCFDGAIYVAEVIWPATESTPPKDLHPALQKFKPVD